MHRVAHREDPHPQCATGDRYLDDRHPGGWGELRLALGGVDHGVVQCGPGLWDLDHPSNRGLYRVYFNGGLVKLLLPLKRWFWLQLGLCVFLGFEYGMVVSLGMVLVGVTQGQVFVAYWLSGLLFDGYHALGNLAFYPLLKVPLTKALDRYLN